MMKYWMRNSFLLIALVLLFQAAGARAEGTKELTANGGNRAMTYYRTDVTTLSNRTFVKIYADVGETINLGSSANGLTASALIRLTKPNGTVVSSPAPGAGGIGIVTNLAQELAGPLPNVGGYNPWTVTVAAGEAGVWVAEFTSPTPTSTANPAAMAAGFAWTRAANQPTTASFVVAWDATVRSSGGSAINGRVYLNKFSGNMGANSVNFNAILTVLTRDGVRYLANANGIDPFGFHFFVNNKGFKSAGGAPLYQSVLAAGALFQDPEVAETAADTTAKMFLNTPDALLPTTANIAAPWASLGTTWIINPIIVANISAISYTGTNGTPSQIGSGLGGTFTFTADNPGFYRIVLDLNANTVQGDGPDVVLTGPMVAGVNTAWWNGTNGLGVPAAPVAGGNMTVTPIGGEVHFPYLDAENNPNGLILQRLNGPNLPDYTVYWNDTNFAGGTAALAGTNSSGGAHRWTAAFGDVRGLDTWTFAPGNPLVVPNPVIAQADLEVVSKTPSPASPAAGSTVSYTIIFRNNGPSLATNASVIDVFDAKVTNVVIVSTNITGSGSVAAASVTGNTFNGSLNLSSNATITLVLSALVRTNSSGTLTNIARILRPNDNGDTNDLTRVGAANNSKTNVATIVTAPDVITTKTGPTNALAGTNIVYTIAVTNSPIATAAATNVLVADALPAGATFVSASSGGVLSNTTVRWPLMNLAQGAGTNFTLTITVPASGPITNVISSTSLNTDGDPANNDGSSANARVITTITPLADVRTTKTGLTNAFAGTNLTYTITVTNLGPSTAGNVVVSDLIPTNSAFVSANGGGTYSGASGTVTWPAMNLTNTATTNLTVTITAPGSGPITNRVSSTADTGDTVPTNNDGSAAAAQVITTLTPVADVFTTKTGLTNALAGTNFTYTITITNLGPSTSSNVVVSDLIPTNSTFVSANGGGTYSGASGTVTWPAMNLTNTAATNFTVTITAPGSGPITNRVSSTATTGDPVPTNNDGSAAGAQVVTTITPLADVRTTKAGLTNALAGTNLTYTITITNLGPSTSSNVVVGDLIPTNSAFVSANGGGTYSGASGTVTWPAMNLTNTATTNFTVTITAPSSGPITNRVSSTATTGDPVPTNNDGSAAAAQVITTLTPNADVAILKSGLTNAIAGTNLTYTIIVTNTGPSAASGVVASDTLPPGVTFLSASSSGTHSAGVVTWPTVATLASGAATNYSVTVTAPMTVTTLTNFASCTSSSADTNAANNDGSAAASRVLTVLTPVADVAMFKTGPTNASVGDPLTFTITLTNLGPHAASNVIASDTLPAGFTFVSASSGGTLSGSVVTWPALSSFANGATTNFTVNVTATTGGFQTNRASCTSLSSDPNPNNNNGTTAPFVVTVVVPYADIVAAKSGPATATTSGSITYTISVTNLGISTAQNVVVRDTLPAGVTFVSASDGGTHAAGVVTWPTIASFLPGGVTNYTLIVTAPTTATTLTNRVSSTSTTDDPDPANNSGSNSVGIVVTTVTPPQADVAVFKSGPTNATVNDPLAFTITVTNLGPTVSSNVVVRDTLPAGFTFVSATGGGTHSSGVITWPALSSFASGAATNFTVNVTASVGGYQTNRAHATANTADPDATNNDGNAAPGQVVTIVIPFADVTVAKTGPASATAGGNLIYTIAATNLGVSTANNVVVSDTLPASVTFVSASSGGTHAAGVVTWPTIAGLPNGAWTNYTVTVTANAAGSLTNVARSTSTTDDPVPGNNDGNNAEAIVITTVSAASSGVLVSGCVYLDANKNLQKDNGETGTGLTLYAKLVTNSAPAGPALLAVAADAGTGLYTFTNVLAGTYRIVLDDNATLADVTPALPAGWTGTDHATGLREPVAVTAVDLPNQNFGLVNAVTLTGKVFLDTGAGGGTANDGARNGGEAGLPGVAVRLTDAAGSTNYSTATTDGGGNFTLLVPSSLANGTVLKVVEANSSAHLSTGAGAGNTGGSYDRASDTLTFTLAVGTSYTGIQFGDVPENAFVNDSQQAGLPGSFVLHAHSFTAGSGGQVAFSAVSAPSPNLTGWSQVMHRDANCNGQIDPGEPVITAALTVVAGERVCILVKDFIPLGAPLNAQDQITLTATFTYTGAAPALSTTHIRTDLTTAGTPTTAGLTLVKAVDKANALPGETLTYTLTYANNGAEVLGNVVIYDETPAYTTFVSAANGALPNSLASVATATPGAGNSGAVRWTFTGTLAPGGTSTVTFTVTLSP